MSGKVINACFSNIYQSSLTKLNNSLKPTIPITTKIKKDDSRKHPPSDTLPIVGNIPDVDKP